MTKNCARCGKEFETTDRAGKYCSDECATESRREKKRKRERERYKAKKKLPQIRKCEYCGKEFEAHKENAIYCSTACGGKKWRELNKSLYSRAKKPKKSEAVQEVVEHKEPERVTPKIPAEFELAGKSIARIAKEARAFGMSYGEYMMRIRCGEIENALKNRGITDWKKVLEGIE